MSRSSVSLLIQQPDRMITPMHSFLRSIKQFHAYLHPLSTPELLLRLQEASSAAQLTRTMNRLQAVTWHTPAKDKATISNNILHVLTRHVLKGTQPKVRIEAASWLRLLVQAGLVTQPEEVFVTLVTATSRLPSLDNVAIDTSEQKSYLTMIFQCFWPFRHPYPAFSRQAFPANQVFYPLAPLINTTDMAVQDTLLGIFAELPTLDDPEIQTYLLPVTLQWSTSRDPERRRRVVNVLARMNEASSREALLHLQTDKDPVVRYSAKSAASYARRA
jgi:hypothetical protein